MKLIEKTHFEAYNWLDFKNLPESKGYKFELYSEVDIEITEFILLFYSLFKKFADDVQIGQFGENAEWRGVGLLLKQYFNPNGQPINNNMQ